MNNCSFVKMMMLVRNLKQKNTTLWECNNATKHAGFKRRQNTEKINKLIKAL